MIRCGRILHIPSSYAAGKRLDRYGLTNSILISVCISPCGYSLVLVSGLGGSPTEWLKKQHGTCCIGDLHVSQWVIIGFYSPKSITCTHMLPLIPRHIYVCRVKSLLGTVTCETSCAAAALVNICTRTMSGLPTTLAVRKLKTGTERDMQKYLMPK